MKIDFSQVSEKLNLAIPGTSVIKTIRAYSSGVAQIISSVRKLFSSVVTQYNGIVQGQIVNNKFIDCTPSGMEGSIMTTIAVTKDDIEMNIRRLESLVDSGDEEVPIAGTNTNPQDMFPTDSITPISIKGVMDGLFVDKDNLVWVNPSFITNSLFNGSLAEFWTWRGGAGRNPIKIHPLGCILPYRVTYNGSSTINLYIRWITDSIAVGFPAGFEMNDVGPNGDYLYLVDKSANHITKLGYIRFTLTEYSFTPSLRSASFTLTDSTSVDGWVRADSHSTIIGTINSVIRYSDNPESSVAVAVHHWPLSLADGAVQVLPGIASVSQRVTIADIAQTLYGSPSNFKDVVDRFDSIVITSE